MVVKTIFIFFKINKTNSRYKTTNKSMKIEKITRKMNHNFKYKKIKKDEKS